MTLAEMRGKTIRSVETIRAEYGRTYDQYICLTFEDGSKVILSGCIPHDPKPRIEEMRKAPEYFSPEDIAAVVLRLEQESRYRKKVELENKRRELEMLKRQLGEE